MWASMQGPFPPVLGRPECGTATLIVSRRCNFLVGMLPKLYRRALVIVDEHEVHQLGTLS